MEEKWYCPIVNEEMLDYDCYDICLVAERMIKETVLCERIRQKENFREICLNCPHHNEQME